LVSRIANEREVKSMTMDVPVYPVWPAVRGPERASMYHRWFSSKPRPWSSPGKSPLKFVMRSATLLRLRTLSPR
jgi:hypothetical protein